MKKSIAAIIVLSCLLSVFGIMYYQSTNTIANLNRVITNQSREISTLTDTVNELSLQSQQIASLESIIQEKELVISNLYYENEMQKTAIAQLETDLDGATFTLGRDMLVLPPDSQGFDCDDSALYMYLYFKGLGYKVRIVQGNLDLTDETESQGNHVWVWVESGGDIYPYDWGRYCPDSQHMEGYPVSYRELLWSAYLD